MGHYPRQGLPGECKPKSRWVKRSSRRHPLIPRDSKLFRDLYHADLVMLARLNVALARARAIPLAA
jgi:hypothetical protein